ncbi:MAG: DUF1566 domain-containing protein, partial [Deltaproteobacteria bacterium]|nr:DUF1566 domain-containing protein [Deltaproteobacteria bacterium]
PQFVVNENNPGDPADDTVTDSFNGLMWQRGSSPAMTWEAAFTYCQQLNDADFAGYNDWHLPDVNELQTLIDRNNYSPAIYKQADGSALFFLNTASDGYWQSTTLPGYRDHAMRVYFDNGSVTYGSGKTDTFYVRLVRNAPAVVDSVVYVDSGGFCDGKSPCRASIMEAYDECAAGSIDSIIKVKSVFMPYAEQLLLTDDKKITLSGGWDPGYSDNAGGLSTVAGSLEVFKGCVTVEGLEIMAPALVVELKNNFMLCAIDYSNFFTNERKGEFR